MIRNKSYIVDRGINRKKNGKLLQQRATRMQLRRNGTPSLFGVLPFEINNENYFSLLGIICTLFGNFPHSSVG